MQTYEFYQAQNNGQLDAFKVLVLLCILSPLGPYMSFLVECNEGFGSPSS